MYRKNTLIKLLDKIQLLLMNSITSKTVLSSLKIWQEAVKASKLMVKFCMSRYWLPEKMKSMSSKSFPTNTLKLLREELKFLQNLHRMVLKAITTTNLTTFAQNSWSILRKVFTLKNIVSDTRKSNGTGSGFLNSIQALKIQKLLWENLHTTTLKWWRVQLQALTISELQRLM